MAYTVRFVQTMAMLPKAAAALEEAANGSAADGLELVAVTAGPGGYLLTFKDGTAMGRSQQSDAD